MTQNIMPPPFSFIFFTNYLILSGEASSDFAAGQVYEFVSTTPVTCDVTSMFHLRQSIASCSAKSRYAFYQYFMLNYLYKRTNTS